MNRVGESKPGSDFHMKRVLVAGATGYLVQPERITGVPK
jgi:hypothetical protein